MVSHCTPEEARERYEALERLDDWLRTPMIVLGLVWLAILVAELVGAESSLLWFLGTAIWIVFIAEFLLRFALAPDKGPFLVRNWLTLLTLLFPALRLVRAFAFLRAARALRSLRLVRIVGAANRSMGMLKSVLRRRAFGYVAGLTLVVIGLGAAGMWSFEGAGQVPGGFTDYGHALWWTGMLVATLGTDYWPVTMEGRLLSAFLALYGLAVFGYIAATFASFFIGRDALSPRGAVAGSDEIERLSRQIERLRVELARQRRTG